MAREIVASLGASLIVPLTVATEVDHMLRTRVGTDSARKFLAALAGGTLGLAPVTPGLLRRAVEIEERYADLQLGLVDASVMAIAERHELPILTFDFADFRATAPAKGEWRLVIDEARLGDVL